MTLGPNQHPFNGLLALAERDRKDKAKEDTLAQWERPASESEEATIQRAARMVRSALANNAWIINEGVTVAAQGSYYNNTNVRQSADMDLRVVHPSFIVFDPPGISRETVNRALEYTYASRTNGQIATELRSQIEATLIRKFGALNVDTSGNRAITLGKVEGSRANIDVVPALGLRNVYQSGLLGPLAAMDGIWILGKDRSETVNYPEQHHYNGVAKRNRTTHRFKKVVRCLKSMRDLIVEAGVLDGAKVPSFLIESLVYNSDDTLFDFDELRAARLRRILSALDLFLGEQLWVDRVVEINGIKPLFGGGQPWTPGDARQFVRAALAYLEG